MKQFYIIVMAILFCATNSFAAIPVTVSGTAVTSPALMPTYPSLADALTALNAVTSYSTNGTIIFTCAAGSTETAPATGLTIGSATLNPLLSATNTVTIIKAGGTVTLEAGAGGTGTPGTAVQDGILNLVGADYITIDGLTFNDSNAANPATMEYGIGLFKFSASDGANNNTIQNCTITLNRINNASGGSLAVDGSRGINVVNALLATQTTVVTVTAASGSNSNNVFYANTIQNCNIGIALIGFADATPFALADQNNDIGGGSSGTGNIIKNFGGGAAAANPAAGIRTLAQYGLNIAFNTINNNDGGGVNHVSTLRGIYTNTATSANQTIRFNNVTLKGGGTSSQMSAIESVAGSTPAGNTVNITNNTITTEYTTATTGTMFGIYNNGASPATLNINNNTFNLSTAAISGTLYPIQVSGAAVTINTNNNNISSIACTAAATSLTFRGIYISAAATTAVYTASTNNVQSVTFAGTHTGAFYFIYCGVTITSINVNFNTITNLTIPSSSTIQLFYLSNSTNNVTVNNNSIVTGFTNTVASSSSFMVLYNFGSPSSLVQNIYNNNFSNININRSAGTTIGSSSGLYGIFWATGAGTNHNLYNNTVSNVTNTGTGMLHGIHLGYGATNFIYNNTVSNLTSGGACQGLVGGNGSTVAMDIYNNNISSITSTAAAGSANGLIVGTAAGTGPSGVMKIYKNTICGVAATGATGVSIGLNFLGAAAANKSNISNNRIANITAPNSTSSTAVSGINIGNNTADSLRLYYNTVHLTGTSGASGFGSSALFANTTPAVEAIDNIFNNATFPTGAGLAVAYRRSSATLASYTAGSNRNDFVASTVYTDGVTPLASLGAYQALVTPRDANSISAAPNFISDVCGNASFLKVNTAIATQIESGGANVSGYTDDFENDIRQGNGGYMGSGTAPDIGADEFSGTPASVCSGTPAASTISGAAAVCTGSGTTLGLSVVYSDLGISHHWASSTVMGGPYTGMGTGSSQATGNLTVPTYFIDTIRCTLSGMFFVTPEKLVGINSLPSVMVSPTTGLLCIPGGAPVPLTASGASTYAWSPATGLSGTSGASVTANPTTTTVYTVTGTDGNGCTNTATSTITVSSAIVMNSVTAVPASVCTGGNTILTANASVPPFTYCTSTHASGCSGDDITNVVLGSIMNPTTGCGGTSHYTYFNPSTPTTTTTLSPGGSPYTLSLSFGTDANQYFGAWIDYDQNGVFSTSEFLGASANAGASGTVGIMFTVPGTAYNGVSRLRIVGGNDSPVTSAQPCGASSSGFGETQDYNVTITGGVDPFTYLWSESPATGTLVSTITNPTSATNITSDHTYSVTATSGAGCTVNGSVDVTVVTGAIIGTQPQSTAKCAGKIASFTVIASGPSLTYQWEESTNGGMSWNPVSDGGVYSGSTTLTLTLTGVNLGMNSYRYRCVVTSVCGSPQTSDGLATLTVNPNPTASMTPVGTDTLCAPATLTLTASTNIGDTYQWKKNNVVIGGATMAMYSASTSGIYRVIISVGATGCKDSTAVNDTLVVNAQPIITSITPASAGICAGGVQEIVAVTPSVGTVLSENFNGAVPGWTSVNNSTGGTDPAAAAWQLYLSAPTFKSNDSTNFVLTDSDAQGSGGQTDTKLNSPVFNLSSYTSCNLNFYHYFNWWSTPDTARVQVSTDNVNWTTVAQYNSDQGAAAAWVPVNIDLSAYVGQATVYVRFWYKAAFGFYWGVDNVLITGNQNPSRLWSPTAGLYLDMGLSMPYTNENVASVFAAPASTTTYILTVTSPNGCTNTATSNITVETTVVKSQANSGGGSLRSVYGCIADGGTITYDYPLADTSFMTAPLVISKNVTIVGNGNVLIDFQGAMAQGLDINAAKTITLDNINVRGGAGVTNAVTNNGTLKLSAATVKGVNTPVVQNNAGGNVEVIMNSGTSNIKQN